MVQLSCGLYIIIVVSCQTHYVITGGGSGASCSGYKGCVEKRRRAEVRKHFDLQEEPGLAGAFPQLHFQNLIMCSTISSTPRLLGLCFLLLCFLQARSHPDRVRNPSVCQTLNIGHDSAESLSESELSVKLVSTSNDGTEHAVSCYNPSTEYKSMSSVHLAELILTSLSLFAVVIESLQGRSIRGLIVVQDGNEGDFPYLPNRSILPTGLTHALCERSVSHK